MSSNNAVQALLKPTSEHGRNTFGLDNRHVYSQKAGQIVPVKAIHYEPNTYLDIQAHDFTMTFPMSTAPFLRGRKEFSFYSVYYNAVWSLFNQYQGTRNDPKTSAFGQSPNLAEPRIALAHMYMSCCSQFLYFMCYEHILPYFVKQLNNTWKDAHFEEAIARARQSFLIHEFRGVWTVRTDFNLPDPENVGSTIDYSFTFDIFDILGSFIPSDNYAPSFLGDSLSDIDNETYCRDVVGHFRAYNWVRKLDMLGYGNIYPALKDLERSIINQLDNYTGSQPDYVYELVKGLFKRVFTYIYFTADSGSVSSPQPKYVNLYPICAYNSVFYHFFRNSYYDLSYYTHDYNLDFVSVPLSSEYGDSNIVHMYDFGLRFLDIEYHQWKKDTFTAVLPDTQFGAVSSIHLSSVSGSDVGRWDANSNKFVRSDNALFNANNTLLTQQGLVSHTHEVSSSFDVVALKRAEMLQEYRQQLLRAGNKTSDVFRAIYGKAASSEHEDDIIPRFLDTFGEDIFVDPVLATANTGESNPNGNLGDIAARGKFRGDSGKIKFNAGGNFGLILVLSYVVPTSEYNSYMLDKHILELTPEDHYIPQFENLGLEPIYSDELNSLLPAANLSVLGFAPRYHHKKSDVDLVHGAFCSWIPDYASEDSYLRGLFGDFNNWVSPRTDLQNRTSTSVRDFYINPSILDNVFVRAAGADIADDQFICNTFFEVNAIKSMSKIGLINFV